MPSLQIRSFPALVSVEVLSEGSSFSDAFSDTFSDSFPETISEGVMFSVVALSEISVPGVVSVPCGIISGVTVASVAGLAVVTVCGDKTPCWLAVGVISAAGVAVETAEVAVVSWLDLGVSSFGSDVAGFSTCSVVLVASEAAVLPGFARGFSPMLRLAKLSADMVSPFPLLSESRLLLMIGVAPDEVSA